LGRGESGLTIYVGQAGEKYSDPEDWRDLVREGRLRAETVIALRRGGELLHQRAGEAPELASLFAPLIQPGAAAPPDAAGGSAEATTEQWRTVEPQLAARASADVLVLSLDKGQPARSAAPAHTSDAIPSVPHGPTPAGASSSPSGLTLFQRCLTRDFFQVRGRAGRREFWSFLVFQLIVLVALPVLAGTAGTNDAGDFTALGGLLLIGWALFVLGCMIPSIAVTIRRLHDIGASAWLLLIVLVPYIGGVLLLIAAALPSQAGANRYGPAAA
jgi:uncharacterized membrane protein YhaH (DUF805 family)